MKKTLFLCIALSVIACAVADATAQRRDYLTEAELELVRDAQEIDLRIAVLTTAADRRFLVLAGQLPSKENDKWGPSPTGTRIELLIDIQRIIQKAIDDIDDVAARNMDAKIFPKAVWGLADACGRYAPKFKTLLDEVRDEKERGAILTSIELCAQVAEASAKVPREPQKQEKKKKKDDN